MFQNSTGIGGRDVNVCQHHKIKLAKDSSCAGKGS